MPGEANVYRGIIRRQLLASIECPGGRQATSGTLAYEHNGVQRRTNVHTEEHLSANTQAHLRIAYVTPQGVRDEPAAWLG